SLRKYITSYEDYEELLYHILTRLATEAWHFEQYRIDPETEEMPRSVEIDVEEFLASAREVNIHDVRPFYNCRLFKKNFVLDDEHKKIVMEFGKGW
ncbi:hypothetical protein HK102_012423, partial [Quaeritorhiza haematococci]